MKIFIQMVKQNSINAVNLKFFPRIKKIPPSNWIAMVSGRRNKLKGTPFIRINASVDVKLKTLLNPGPIKYSPSRDLPTIKNKLSNFLNHFI
jgi:hypothetical protein